MNDPEITALARVYAEFTDLSPVDKKNVSAICENFLKYTLRRYCLVEKSKLKTKHKEALAALESNDNEDVKWGTYRLSLLKSLFPEIAKEVGGIIQPSLRRRLVEMLEEFPPVNTPF